MSCLFIYLQTNSNFHHMSMHPYIFKHCNSIRCTAATRAIQKQELLRSISHPRAQAGLNPMEKQTAKFNKRQSIIDPPLSLRINQTDYLQNYDQMFNFLTLDVNPTQPEVDDALEQLTTYMSYEALFSILDRLNQKVAEGKIEQLLQEAHQYEIIQEEQVNIKTNYLKDRANLNQKGNVSDIDGFPRKTRYEYDPTPVPKKRRPEEQPKDMKTAVITQDTVLPLFKQDVPYEYNESDYYSSTWEGQLISSHFQLSAQEYEKYLQKQLTARALIERDYGYPSLKQQIIHSNSTIDIQPMRYKVVSTSMIIDVYRKLEEYISQKFKPKYIPLASVQLRILHSVMLNGLKTFPQREAATLKRFISIVFSLSPKPLTISPHDAMELYRHLHIILNNKMNRQYLKPVSLTSISSMGKDRAQYVEFPIDKRPSDFWTAQNVKLLVDSFIKHQSLRYVRQQIRERYPQLKVVKWLDYNFVKNKLCKIVREGLRKIQVIIPHENILLPKKMEINDARIKQVNRSMQTLDLQMLLAQIYRDNSYNVSNIREVMRLYCEFFDTEASCYMRFKIPKIS